MQTATEFVPGATSGNETSIEIEAPPEQVWDALHSVTASDVKLTSLLMGIRSIPAILMRRGSLTSRRRTGATPLLSAMQGRFALLAEVPGQVLTLGLVGQFWRINGGEDAHVVDVEDFVSFREPGFVKSAIDFVLVPTDDGTRLTTTTRSMATDVEAERRFRRYWAVVGPGSKLIRHDMLRAVKRRAEAG